MNVEIELTSGAAAAAGDSSVGPREERHAPAPVPASGSEVEGAEFTTIEPPKGWEPLNFRELWRHRELMFFLVWRDVKVRYKQTLLGAAWALLQPALMMVVFTIFFGQMAKVSSGGLPYSVFVYTGLVAWTFFATSVSNAGNSVVSSERLITKIYFPRLAIPFAAVGAALVDLAIAFSLVVVLMAWNGVMPGASVLALPVIVGVILLSAAGVGTFLAALNVSYRDFRYVIPFLVQLWMFATPTIYMDTAGKSMGPAVKTLIHLNPMTGLIAAFRNACLGSPIDWAAVGMSAVLGLVMFVGGCVCFRATERKFADVI